MKNYCQKLERGFTLIELLIVIAIIGVLSSFVITSSITYPKRARDSQRKSDINEYRIAIENFSIKNNGVYLMANSNAVTVCGTIGTKYMSSCPSDPTGGTYHYQSDGSSYILWAQLESSSNLYWYVCSNGVSVEKTGSPASTDCGF